MPVLAVGLAALAAAAYGAADFTGAVATRRLNALLVTLGVQAASLACLIAALFLAPPGRFDQGDLVWGAVGGLGAAVGLVLFYRALALGPMSVAAALTALWSAGLPVMTGLGLGERPAALTLAGVALAVPSAVLVSIDSAGGGHRRLLIPRDRFRDWQHRARTRALAVGAGAGFALFFIALSRTSGDTGLLPLVGARVASIAGLVAVTTAGRHWQPVPGRWWPALAGAGLLDFVANASYLLAVQRGSLAWVAAISSLYPVTTVVLARLILHERLGRAQRIGLPAAVLALTLVGLGNAG